MDTLDCYFTTISPWAYLGMRRLRHITTQAGMPVRYLPVEFGRILASVEVKPLGQRPMPLQVNRMQELRRWREYLDIPLTLEPAFFPTDPNLSSRMIAVAGVEKLPVATLTESLLAACWAEELDISDPETLVGIADRCDIDGTALLEAARQPLAAELVAGYTDEGLARGVLGSPTYVLGEEVFFGQDRLDFVARALGV